MFYGVVMSTPDPLPPSSVVSVNAMAADELRMLLLRCIAVPRWVEALVDGRPYADTARLYAHAEELTAGLSDAEIRLALDDHPRIGKQPPRHSSTATWSTAEQSGVNAQDTRLAAALSAGNIEYERHFGHIYLVCATGRSGEEILADLRARLTNDPSTEIAVARRELGRIARIRLSRIVSR